MQSEFTFHPLVADWFDDHFGEPTAPQRAGWPAIASGADTLIAAPTGSGKTLAAFLWSVNRLVEQGLDGARGQHTQVVYISPLKALGNDVERNLRVPLLGIGKLAQARGLAFPEIRVAVRSGDTPSADRSRMRRQPPHILITTPESFYILLTAEGSRRFLGGVRTVIVDEIHAVAGDKRGAHLALSLERLDTLVGRRVQRVGLSATQRPIEAIAALLVGVEHAESGPSPRPCHIVDVGHQREMELRIEIPDQELGPVASHELWAEVFDRIVQQVQAHRTTLVFVNTRRQVERVAHQLGERLGPERVAAHHGSLSRETRLAAEQRLKQGDIPVIVATASLELGIDIGHVDVVCHVGAPRLIATLLQRVGRSGHWLDAIPKGVLYPMTRDDLVQCAAAVRAVRQGQLDHIDLPTRPLDILAQQIVATVAAGAMGEDELYALVRRAQPYGNLERAAFDRIVELLSEGIATGRGRRGAHLHRDGVNRVLRPRRGARLAAITSGGAIPDVADYDVVEEPAGTFVGRVHEDFAVESMGGDIFLLGNQSWRIRRVEAGRVRVEDAHGAPPTIPFWLGEATSRSVELSAAVSELRAQVAELAPVDREAAVRWLSTETGVPRAGADQIVDYLLATRRALGVVPTQGVVVAERFFDESGGMQLVLHAPFGGRINRAWGLALRKRFCVTFDFELQAAATDDGIVISLGEQHSFPLDSVFGMVRLPTLRADLTQAALASPMFTNRWRWNASRALALLRFEGGRRVPMPIQRMRAEDLLAAVFPDQIACQDNRTGPIVPPDHPLVNETLDNCLTEAMDIEGLRAVLEAIEGGAIRTVAVETPLPSLMSHEILNANPYAFLDNAPLEERRARAVALRRTDPDLAAGVGALDPEAIAVVRAQAWPDVRDAEELHDALLSLGLLPLERTDGWRGFVDELVVARRATVATWEAGGVTRSAIVAAERLALVQSALGPLHLAPPLDPPTGPPPGPDDGVRALVQGWLEASGPVTAHELAGAIGLTEAAVHIALAALEGAGIALRGSFTGAATPGAPEWCERRLLARIHRMTIVRLRQEIEPVNTAQFLRFLLRWQHLAPGTQLHGRDGLLEVIGQLQGLELPAPAWEASVLPGRVRPYAPADLEQLCLAGLVAWGRLSYREPDDETAAVRGAIVAHPSVRPRQAPSRQAPLAIVLRDDLGHLLSDSLQAAARVGGAPRAHLSAAAQEVAEYLARRGASFLSDMARGTGRLPAEVEDALWELVARGIVTGDGVAGLRVLLQPDEKRRSVGRHLRALRGGHGPARLMPVGRWSLWGDVPGEPVPEDVRVERFARQLLRRYGVVFRDLLAREAQAPPWRALLAVYRRLEARGEIRGGRFVAGFVGEQYALPEAVEALRTVRRQRDAGEVVLVHSGDPLNLVGILTPGARVSPYANQVIAFRDGLLLATGSRGEVLSRLQAAVS